MKNVYSIEPFRLIRLLKKKKCISLLRSNKGILTRNKFKMMPKRKFKQFRLREIK